MISKHKKYTFPKRVVGTLTGGGGEPQKPKCLKESMNM